MFFDTVNFSPFLQSMYIARIEEPRRVTFSALIGSLALKSGLKYWGSWSLEHNYASNGAEDIITTDSPPKSTGKMVEKFVGTWKMVTSDNFDEYMKALGMRFFFITF